MQLASVEYPWAVVYSIDSPNMAKVAPLLGIGIVAVSLLALVTLGLYLRNRPEFKGSHFSTDAVIYIDVPGRIAVDSVLQADGPVPVLVSAGSHTLTFFDIAASPIEVSIAPDEFVYIPNPRTAQAFSADVFHGSASVSAFPPNTTIEIPDCTPLTAKQPVVCKSTHTLTAKLSPGAYTIQYSNPHLGNYREELIVGAHSHVARSHSFISTVPEWDSWRRQHGQIIERRPREYSDGDSDALLVPFEATAGILEELFD